MKKIIAALLMFGIISLNTGVYAKTKKKTQPVQPVEVSEPLKGEIHEDAPVWAEYVAPKYREPRSDFSKGASISELTVGIILTELILTSPIGIPMVIHGTTKVKMVSYNNRKNIFDEEIKKAQTIEDDTLRQQEYQRILKRCHLKESTRKHYAKKEAKAKLKAEKKAKKQEKKLQKKAS